MSKREPKKKPQVVKQQPGDDHDHGKRQRPQMGIGKQKVAVLEKGHAPVLKAPERVSALRARSRAKSFFVAPSATRKQGIAVTEMEPEPAEVASKFLQRRGTQAVAKSRTTSFAVAPSAAWSGGHGTVQVVPVETAEGMHQRRHTQATFHPRQSNLSSHFVRRSQTKPGGIGVLQVDPPAETAGTFKSQRSHRVSLTTGLKQAMHRAATCGVATTERLDAPEQVATFKPGESEQHKQARKVEPTPEVVLSQANVQRQSVDTVSTISSMGSPIVEEGRVQYWKQVLWCLLGLLHVLVMIKLVTLFIPEPIPPCPDV